MATSSTYAGYAIKQKLSLLSKTKKPVKHPGTALYAGIRLKALLNGEIYNVIRIWNHRFSRLLAIMD